MPERPFPLPVAPDDRHLPAALAELRQLLVVTESCPAAAAEALIDWYETRGGRR